MGVPEGIGHAGRHGIVPLVRMQHPKRVDEKAQLGRPVMAHRVLEVVVWPDRDRHGAQMRRIECGECALRSPGIRAANRTDGAVAPLLGSEPFHRVVAVLALALRARAVSGERIPGAARGVAPAHVLHCPDVAAAREEVAGVAGAQAQLVVGRPLQDDRKPPRRALTANGWEVQVGLQGRPIAGRHHHVALVDHVVERSRTLAGSRSVCGFHCSLLTAAGRRAAAGRQPCTERAMLTASTPP